VKNTKEYEEIINLIKMVDSSKELLDKIQYIPSVEFNGVIDSDDQAVKFEYAFEAITERNSVYKHRLSYG
jgi:hypothetical protein